ncbi:10916_t:CDS:2 [Entrophospora sp. SA101]|nr:10916_t:CDS:2 [Entrophospora sp. SA101]
MRSKVKRRFRAIRREKIYEPVDKARLEQLALGEFGLKSMDTDENKEPNNNINNNINNNNINKINNNTSNNKNISKESISTSSSSLNQDSIGGDGDDNSMEIDLKKISTSGPRSNVHTINVSKDLTKPGHGYVYRNSFSWWS